MTDRLPIGQYHPLDQSRCLKSERTMASLMAVSRANGEARMPSSLVTDTKKAAI